MKMISSTSTTSTSGVMLISDCRSDPELPLLNSITYSPCAPALRPLAISPTPRKPACSTACMASRTWRKLSLASPRITILGSDSAATAARRASPNCSAATCLSLTHSPPPSSMETRIRPLSSPCWVGFSVFGKRTSGPFRICGAITMKMINSTSTTSTSGVTLMDACILAPSPSRIRILLRIYRHLVHRHLGHPLYELLRRLVEAIHHLGCSPIHLDVEILYPAREVVESGDGRDRDEDAQRRRDQGLGDAARNYRHASGPGGRDVPKSVDDSSHGTEEADERGRRTDRSQEPKTRFQLYQRLRHGVSECARDKLE